MTFSTLAAARARLVLFVVLTGFPMALSWAESATVAAASSLRPTLDRIAEAFMEANSEDSITIIYGASGRLTAQILNGAPFDAFLSADTAYPGALFEQAPGTSEPVIYALGRLVFWSANHDVTGLALTDLTQDRFRRIAIAQPAIAPYGQRAREALEAVGVWAQIENRVVYGENISQVAQMSASGAADVAITALSLAMLDGLVERPYALIDDSLHEPLAQSMVVTARGQDNGAARRFIEFMRQTDAADILLRAGFQMPVAGMAAGS
ncbi:MAG TPA: molybdate ABC transporter substrate-binding protein [Pseudohongiella sp.]|nr:molybdate ABC transporter substrate-binding protein [Pseudohongiella sp.]HBX38494.1 molybdate ABC transporter substrate-binding protein [Pseudohongiella sp.]|tara:strand:+ start:75388 stop:76185 length:798 start_codon:yes stop_codon:yes gene_type:complete